MYIYVSRSVLGEAFPGRRRVEYHRQQETAFFAGSKIVKFAIFLEALLAVHNSLQ